MLHSLHSHLDVVVRCRFDAGCSTSVATGVSIVRRLPRGIFNFVVGFFFIILICIAVRLRYYGFTGIHWNVWRQMFYFYFFFCRSNFNCFIDMYASNTVFTINKNKCITNTLDQHNTKKNWANFLCSLFTN